MRVVMTGATSGIGLFAARKLLAEGAELLIGARRPAAAPADLAGRARFETLDLADLSSTRPFAERARAAGPIDALVLNAGLQSGSPARSAQGLELTFAANHLAHFLLIEALAGELASGGRIILTSSGTHDPDLHTGMPAPLHADAGRLARPETDPQRDTDPGRAGRRAYSSSKLCNVMTVRELALRLAPTRADLAVMAFDPGFTPGTGLARSYPAPVAFLFRHVLPLVIRGERVSTPAVSGALLADLVTEPRFAGARGAYLSVRSRALAEVEPSRLARDDAACAKLWSDSEGLLAEAAALSSPAGGSTAEGREGGT